MRTRLITSLAILDGLLLLFLSLVDVKQLRQESEQFQAEQRLNTYLNTYYHVGNVEFVSSQPAGPNSLVWTRTWILSVAGAALTALGVLGLLRNRSVHSRLADPNHPAAQIPAEVAAPTGHLRPSLVLAGLGLLSVYLLIDLLSGHPSADPSSTTRMPYLISKLPPVPARLAWNIYSKIWDDPTPVKVPYNPAAGSWRVLQGAITSFAGTNGIQIFAFESLSPTQAYVSVDGKHASIMRNFLSSLAQSTNNTTAPTSNQSVSATPNPAPPPTAPVH